MRKAKDNSRVPTRYFRPDVQHGPRCGAPLQRQATVQDRVLITLEGRFRLISPGYCCSRLDCPNADMTAVSPEPARLRLKELIFGFDVVVRIGWWRLREHGTLDEIWALTQARPLTSCWNGCGKSGRRLSEGPTRIAAARVVLTQGVSLSPSSGQVSQGTGSRLGQTGTMIRDAHLFQRCTVFEVRVWGFCAY